MLHVTNRQHLPTQPFARVETITPETACKLLCRNVSNRTIKPRRVRLYRDAILKGHWRLNGEAIKIAPNGRLLDGQHRLLAVTEADSPIDTFVMYNIPEDVFTTLDYVSPRNGNDALTVSECKYSAVCAGASRIVNVVETQRTLSAVNLTPTEIQEWVTTNPRIVKSAEATYRAGKIMSPSTAAALHFVFSKIDRAEADRFFRDFTSGAGLSKGDGVLLLRDRMMRNKLEKAKLPPMETIAMTIRAWNARRRGETMKKLYGTLNKGDNALCLPEAI